MAGMCVHTYKCNTRLKKMMGKEQILALMSTLDKNLNVGRLARSFCSGLAIAEFCIRVVGDCKMEKRLGADSILEGE